MNVSLPDAMKSWVEAQAASGRYGNASDYVRALIRRDQERSAAITELQALIDDGIASGISTKTVAEIIAEARAAADAEELA